MIRHNYTFTWVDATSNLHTFVLDGYSEIEAIKEFQNLNNIDMTRTNVTVVRTPF